MARTKQDVEALIQRMNGPPNIRVVILTPSDASTYLGRRKAEESWITALYLHPNDLEATWPDFCYAVAHELGHPHTRPRLSDLVAIIARLPRPIRRRLERLRQEHPLCFAYVEEILELITGHREQIEIEADRHALKYLGTVNLGLETVLNNYELEIDRHRWFPRLLRWLIVGRIRRHVRILKGQNWLPAIEALGI